MKRRIIETVGGLIICISGFVVAYLFMDGRLGTSAWLILVSMLIVGLGFGVLFHAGRLEGSKPKFKDIIHDQAGGANVIERNNAMVKEWSKTTETSDKLKVIELSNGTNDQNIS